MYYGKSDSLNQAYSEKVWDANYMIVQHFNELSGILYDSTSNENDGTPFGSIIQNAMGKIDGADSFDGVNDYVDCGNSNSVNPTNALTLEAWYKTVSFEGTGNDPIIDKGYVSHQPPYYQYLFGVSGDKYINDHAEFSFAVVECSTRFYTHSRRLLDSW